LEVELQHQQQDEQQTKILIDLPLRSVDPTSTTRSGKTAASGIRLPAPGIDAGITGRRR